MENRVYLKRDLPSGELVQTFRKTPAIMIGDYMGRNYALHCSIRLMPRPVKNMCESASTVQGWGGDNLSFHKVLDTAQERGAIVMATSFCDTNSVTGENIMANVTFKKLGDLVFDAPVRDIRRIFKMKLPVYAADTTPGGPHKGAPGEINVPVSCGSCFIYPGNIIVGDMGGVVVVPLRDVEAVLETAQKYYVVDIHSQEEAVTGSWNREWIDRDLKTAGIGIIDGCYRRQASFYLQRDGSVISCLKSGSSLDQRVSFDIYR